MRCSQAYAQEFSTLSSSTELDGATVFGWNYGQVSSSSAIRLGGTACVNTRWISDSSMSCKPADGYACTTQLSCSYFSLYDFIALLSFSSDRVVLHSGFSESGLIATKIPSQAVDDFLEITVIQS